MFKFSRVIPVLIPVLFLAACAGRPHAIQPSKVAKSSWVKLCDKIQLKEKNGRTVRKRMCLTHHERLDARSGLVIVSAGIRKIEGRPGEKLLVVVPNGMALKPGMQIKIDGGRPIKLQFDICTGRGCVASRPVTRSIIKAMRSGKRMIVATITRNGKAIGFPVPLNGFSAAYDGVSVNPGAYSRARSNLIRNLRRRGG